MGRRTTTAPLTIGQAVGRELRAEAAAQGWTQTRIAQALRVSQSQVSRRMTGQAAVRIDDLDQLCALLGLTLGELIDRAEKRAYARKSGCNTAVNSPHSTGEMTLGGRVTSWAA